MMNLPPLGPASSCFLVAGLLMAAIIMLAGVLAVKDTGLSRVSVIILSFGLVVAAIVVLIAFWVPERLLLSVILMLFGLTGVVVGLSATTIPEPKGMRAHGVYALGRAIGGQAGVHVVSIAAGLLFLLCGLMGLLTYLGLF